MSKSKGKALKVKAGGELKRPLTKRPSKSCGAVKVWAANYHVQRWMNKYALDEKPYMLVSLGEYRRLRAEVKELGESNARLRKLVSFAICKLNERKHWDKVCDTLMANSERIKLQPKRMKGKR